MSVCSLKDEKKMVQRKRHREYTTHSPKVYTTHFGPRLYRLSGSVLTAGPRAGILYATDASAGHLLFTSKTADGRRHDRGVHGVSCSLSGGRSNNRDSVRRSRR